MYSFFSWSILSIMALIAGSHSTRTPGGEGQGMDLGGIETSGTF